MSNKHSFEFSDSNGWSIKIDGEEIRGVKKLSVEDIDADTLTPTVNMSLIFSECDINLSHSTEQLNRIKNLIDEEIDQREKIDGA